MTDDITMRRTPRQGRGQQRVEKILAAAADVLAEVGYENATTNAIAARAETAIGSLYQYFPNKEAIIEALGERYAQDMHQRLTETAAALGGLRLPDVLTRLAEAMSAYYLANPGFQAIFQLSPHLQAVGSKLHQAIIDEVAVLIAPQTQQMDGRRRRLCAEVIVSAFKPLLILLVESPAENRDLLRAEVRRLAVAYAREIEDKA